MIVLHGLRGSMFVGEIEINIFQSGGGFGLF